MLIRDQKAYPRATDFLTGELPELPRRNNKVEVWNAFRRVSGLASETAARLLGTNDDLAPLVRVKDLSHLRPPKHVTGLFDADRPYWIFVDSELMRRFEPAAEQAQAQRLLEATVLHELIHWAEYYRGNIDREVEQGWRFEREAYGVDADIRPFWPDARFHPRAITSLDADLRQFRESGQRNSIFSDCVSRGLRNNNPGYIRTNLHGLLPGELHRQSRLPVHQAESVFAVFETPAAGLKALLIELEAYARMGSNTAGDVACRWAMARYVDTDDEAIAQLHRQLQHRKDAAFLGHIQVQKELLEAIVMLDAGNQPYEPEIFDQVFRRTPDHD